MKIHPFTVLFIALGLSVFSLSAQPITGVWKGKIDGKNVELKIVKNGDSLTGTSYYYASANSYRRYSIKGYFDGRDNSVVWWDDQLIEEKNNNRPFGLKNTSPYLSNADFNCPGGTAMYLTGDAFIKEKEEEKKGNVALQKTADHKFNDEWDDVIENYTLGANDPELIDSIGKMAFTKNKPIETPTLAEEKPKEKPKEKPVKEVAVEPKKQVYIPAPKKETVALPKPAPPKEPIVIAPLSNEQKFNTRRKVIQQEITVTSDSIELNFYDNAEVDGDSIAIFLNNRMLFEHVRLSEKAYTIKLATAELAASNELVMVAENLGSIPPNTSLMIAYVDGKRYETRLESTEQTSAAIRFVRRPAIPQ